MPNEAKIEYLNKSYFDSFYNDNSKNIHTEKCAQEKGNVYSDNRSVVSNYATVTTLHGFKHTSLGSPFRRVCWLVICLGMIVGIIITIYSQTKSIFEYPTVTKHDVIYSSKLPFPAVTLCNLNQFTEKAVDEHPGFREVLAAISPLSSHLGLINWSNPVYQKYTTYSYDENFYKGMLMQAAHNISHTIVKCTLDNLLRPCEDLFTTRFTDFGVCYTFNGRLPGNNQTVPWESTITGNKYGLGVTINVMQDMYVLGENNDAAGIRVVLHPFDEIPLVQDQGFNVGPGQSIYASLNMKKVKFLPAPYSAFENKKCVNTSDPKFSFPLKYSSKYCFNQCLLECQYEYTAKKCGCKGSYDQGDVPYCAPRMYVECFNKEFDKFRRNHMDKCDCPFPCDHVTYDVRLSSSYFPSKGVVDLLPRIFPHQNFSEASLRRDYLELRIFFEKFVLETTEQQPKFTFDSILSTFGGQMGIFLGASIISFVELLEFICEFLYQKCLKLACCIRCCSKKTSPAK